MTGQDYVLMTITVFALLCAAVGIMLVIAGYPA